MEFLTRVLDWGSGDFNNRGGVKGVCVIIAYDFNGRPHFPCTGKCGQGLEIGELIILGNGVHCIYCKGHLGYEHDLPGWVLSLLRRGM